MVWGQGRLMGPRINVTFISDSYAEQEKKKKMTEASHFSKSAVQLFYIFRP